MKFFPFIVLSFFLFVHASAQEHISSLKYNPQLMQASKKVQHPKYRSVDTLNLPFFDDFSKPDEVYPDPELWINKGAFVNTTYPVNPISIGVVTLDGLTQDGLPYDTTGFSFAGGADTLTSLPMYLQTHSPLDSVYFSFYYEAQGYGDEPNVGDSLVLEFKNDSAQWIHVWGLDGPDSLAPIANQFFKQVRIPVTDTRYFYPGFQFRFRNIATLSGNNDHWNLDYIYLRAGSNVNDTTINDEAIMYIPTSMLKNYQQMPWSQFKGFENDELAAFDTMFIKNSFGAPKNTTYGYSATENFSGNLLSSFSASVNIPADVAFSRSFSTFNITNNPAIDSASVAIKYSIGGVSGDTHQENDTVVKHQNFFDYYAYDDGSAEKAYSLYGKGAELAYKFHANVADTLRAIQISFTNIQVKTTDRILTLLVFKSVMPTEVLQYQSNFLTPVYVDSINGFYTYVLDTPQAINGDFYIGVQQPDADYLFYGLDVNTDSHKNLYFNALGTWQQSEINGSLLIRPIVGNKVNFASARTIAGPDNNLVVYPNPVENVLTLKLSVTTQGRYSIVDCTGRTILQSNRLTPTIDVTRLTNGLYLLKVDDLTGKTYFTKFIKD